MSLPMLPELPPLCVDMPTPLQVGEIRELAVGSRVIDHAPSTQLPLLCLVNGEPMMRDDWARRYLLPGDQLTWVHLPQGGGDGGSDPLRAVLTIVVLVVAVATQQYYLAAGYSAGAAALAGAAVAAGGQLVINAVAPLPRPPRPVAAQQAISGSPTYQPTVRLAANQARLNQPIPVIYGRHIIVPDLACSPYYTTANNVQTFRAMYVIGHGRYAVESITLDDTPIGTYPGAVFKVVEGPGDQDALVPDTVFPVGEVGNQELQTNDWVGYFAVCGAGETVSQVQVDLAMPQGLYIADNLGNLNDLSVTIEVQLQPIDDYGNPDGAAAPAESFTYTNDSVEPLRFSERINAPNGPGRYQIRLRRTEIRGNNPRAGARVIWTAALGVRPQATQMLPGVTYLYVAIPATQSLSQTASQRVRAVVKRLLPTWAPGQGWSDEVETRAIAWAFADAVRNPVYGAGQPDELLDLPEIFAVHTVLNERRDRFDGIFDTREGLWAALQSIARAGRCVPVLNGSQISLVRDQAVALPVAMFTPRNMARGSFSMEYQLPTGEAADGVTLQYFDQVSWSVKEVTAPAPGVVNPVNPAVIQSHGITQPEQAQREAVTIAAESFYRRRSGQFRTDAEGLAIRYGDLILIAHDLPSWGSTGELISSDAGSQQLVLSEPVPDTFPASFTVYAITDTGQTADLGAASIAAGASDRKTIELDAIDGETFPTIFEGRERPRYALSEPNQLRQLARVTGVTPNSLDEVSISWVIEDDRVHEADVGIIVPPDAPGGTPTGETLVINADQTALNLRDYYNSVQGDPGATAVSVTFEIASTVRIDGGTPGNQLPAIATGAWPDGSIIKLRNLGDVAGYGGGGGNATQFGGGVGGKGGTGLLVTYPLELENVNRIQGGGGGGGAGAANTYDQGGEPQFVPGGGGGGGAGREPGAGGAGATGSGVTSSDGFAGSETSGGSGGPGAAHPQANGSPGGAGGGLGEAGRSTSGGGNGGAAGFAIDGDALVTYINRGALAGEIR